MIKHRNHVHLDNLQAFLAEAEASANYQADLELIRTTFDLTQAEMARQFGVSQMTISNWMRGKVKPKCLFIIHLTAERLRQR